MSKSQTLADLKKTGVKLTQAEAQELHTRIADIAKGIHESGELFEDAPVQEMGQANNVLPSTGFTPLVVEKPKVVIEPIVQKKLVAGNFNKKGNTLAADGYKIGDMYPRIEIKQEPEESTDFIVTEEHLEEKPFWLTEDAKVGDTISILNSLIEENKA